MPRAKVVIPLTVQRHREAVARREAGIAELSSAFAPCTIPNWADEWWAKNLAISELRKERDEIEGRLLGYCRKTGEIVEGETIKVRAADYVAEVNQGKPIWKWRLEVVRE